MVSRPTPAHLVHLAHISHALPDDGIVDPVTDPGPDGYFDEHVAARYEEKWAELFDPAVVDPAVDFLVAHARNGRALELGVGTGRLAIPLARRGILVHGIELSSAMAAR